MFLGEKLVIMFEFRASWVLEAAPGPFREANGFKPSPKKCHTGVDIFQRGGGAFGGVFRDDRGV